MVFALVPFTTAHAAGSASATGTAIQTVLTSIAITADHDLDFGSATPGDLAKTIAAGSPDAATFNVTGEMNQAYNITLPADGTVTMITNAGGSPDEQIPVNTFTSSATGVLDATGAETLSVGATRSALSATQVTGSYTGTFTVTVAY